MHSHALAERRRWRVLGLTDSWTASGTPDEGPGRDVGDAGYSDYKVIQRKDCSDPPSPGANSSQILVFTGYATSLSSWLGMCTRAGVANADRLRAVGLAASLALFTCVAPGCAPDTSDGEAGADWALAETAQVFESTDPVGDLRIAFSKRALFVRDPEEAGRRRDGAEVEATFQAPSLGIAAPVPILLKVRGNTSLNRTECSFPKLSFKFKNKADAASSAFKGLKRIKIATHCGELAPTERTPFGRVANEVAPHREAFVHLVLRTIGLEVPRARPVTINYQDTSGAAGASLVRKATLIEDVDDVAARLGGKEARVAETEAEASEDDSEDELATVEKMNPDEVARVHFAEALIGNDDWRLNSDIEYAWVTPDYRDPRFPFWNMKAVRLPDGSERPIPVDFDLSRITSPTSGPVSMPEHWAGSSEAARSQFVALMHARMRLSRAQLDATRRELVGKKDRIMATLDTPWLDAEGRAAAKTLFESFFSIIEKDKSFYQPVVKSSDLEMLLEDGQPDDECLSNTIMAGTPVIRHGVKNEALGIEQVSLLDVGDALACNKERVWVDSRALRVTTNFPAR